MKTYYIDGSGELVSTDIDKDAKTLIVESGDVDFEPFELNLYKWAVNHEIVYIAGMRMAEAQYIALQLIRDNLKVVQDEGR